MIFDGSDYELKGLRYARDGVGVFELSCKRCLTPVAELQATHSDLLDRPPADNEWRTVHGSLDDSAILFMRPHHKTCTALAAHRAR